MHPYTIEIKQLSLFADAGGCTDETTAGEAPRPDTSASRSCLCECISVDPEPEMHDQDAAKADGFWYGGAYPW